MSEQNKINKALLELSGAFRQFSRNGRWGTCVDCPRDHWHNVYPEFCDNTNRYDHQLNIEQLAENWSNCCK